MICSLVNLLRFISVSFAGEQTNLKVRTFSGEQVKRKFTWLISQWKSLATTAQFLAELNVCLDER